MRRLLTHCIHGGLACTGLWYTAAPSNVWWGGPGTVGVLRHHCQAMQSGLMCLQETLLEERNQLSERLEAVTHDKLLPANHIDSDTPIQKTLKLLQTLILVSICCARLLTMYVAWGVRVRRCSPASCSHVCSWWGIAGCPGPLLIQRLRCTLFCLLQLRVSGRCPAPRLALPCCEDCATDVQPCSQSAQQPSPLSAWHAAPSLYHPCDIINWFCLGSLMAGSRNLLSLVHGSSGQPARHRYEAVPHRSQVSPRPSTQGSPSACP